MQKEERAKMIEELERVIGDYKDKKVDSKDISIKSAIAIRFVLYTGLRVSELVGLRWKDVDFKKKHIKVRQIIVRTKDINNKGKIKLITQTPKTKKAKRDIPFEGITEYDLYILKSIKKIAMQQYGDAYTDKDLVFATESGRPTEARNLDRSLSAFCKRIGIEHYNMHSCRHTFASDLIANGVSPSIVQKLLGHADIATVFIYVHPYEGDIKEAISKLHTEK